ncbi:hypothetical protein F4680DRAFT_403942 [Xylaria scruposa]|nr:hypothetical protein F4680DRAFT_403942 [Xylaria scruposa]
MILAVHVSHDPNSIEPGRSKIQWEDLETLETFIEKAFPKVRADSDVAPLKPSKLRAMYFQTHANIQLRWTEHLYDHLQLSTSENSKFLKVFQLPCMLEAALEVLKHSETNSPVRRPDVSANNDKEHEQDKTKANCDENTGVSYSHDFLFETLMTLQLLFPAQDRKKLKGKPIRKATWVHFILTRQKLDSHLSSMFVPEGKYQRPLTNRRELYERYPHWGLRLHMLLEEVEDPTPLSWMGRWSERRKAARYSFWVTFAAFVIAIVFGLVATILGVVQVWISYCQWQGEEGGSVCKLHGSTTNGGMKNNTSS